MKLKKACDIYMLTVKYLRYAGDKTLNTIILYLNKLIEHIKHLSSSQLNTSIATVVHKSKNKSIYDHRSYRLVRVTPLFGRMLDEYMLPNLNTITKPLQDPNQYGIYLQSKEGRSDFSEGCHEGRARGISRGKVRPARTWIDGISFFLNYFFTGVKENPYLPSLV